MILNSVLNGPLVWPTVDEENGTIGSKKYEELSVAEKLQADWDLKATNIVLQGLPLDVYAIVNHNKVSKEIWVLELSFLCKARNCHYKKRNVNCLAVHVFTQRDDPISCLNKEMAFLTVVGRQGQSYAGTGYKGNVTNSGGNNTGGEARVSKCYNCQGKGNVGSGQILDEEQLEFLANPCISYGQAAQITIPNTAAFKTEDLNAYDSNYDDVSNAKAVLMANLSNYGSEIISEVPHFEPYHTNKDNQSVHAMQSFE
ncbi:hypothetical protein Tco_0706411 [Tanacetum coccineum]|uniref:Uncharacterized protein n=1 Tax=Tanacetum coccineum TaxID=301880 RepID=A0ABQ4Y9B0_9ASTR